ncbi:MAG: TIGR01459 family HAD-type hydrolase [Pseudomonadota bacterium]
MSAPPFIDGLSSLAERYDALLCDAWGVIHDGRKVFPGVEDALTRFRRERGPVIILTNAPKPAAAIGPQLDALGLSRSAYDAIVTSGEATRAEIMQRAPGPAFRIGWDTDAVLYEGTGAVFSAIAEARFIVCTGLAKEYGYDPEAYRPLLREAAAARKEMICANPDIVVRWKGELMYCAGAVARVYEELGGPVIYAGKPHPAVYDLSLRRISEARAEADRSRILAIGDGAGTDILGANEQGFDAVYVVGDGGVHVGGDEAVADALAQAGARATAAMRGLKW